MHLRHAKNGHDGVADELLHRAATGLDDRLHPFEVAGQQSLQGLGVDRLPQHGRTDHIAEHDRDDLAVHARIIAPLAGCNHSVTERIDTERHETSRRPRQKELGPHQTARIDTRRHERPVDMESNKDLKWAAAPRRCLLTAKSRRRLTRWNVPAAARRTMKSFSSAASAGL